MSNRAWAWTLIGMVALAAHASGVVIVDDVEWRQLTETTNCTWNEVAATCPQDATPCTGSVTRASDQSTVNVDGWTWARNPEVRTLLDRVIQPGTENFVTNYSGYTAIDDADIALSVSGPPCWFQPTRIEPYSSGFTRTVFGLSATAHPDGVHAFVPYIHDSIPTASDTAGLGSVYRRIDRSPYNGLWLYRPLQGPTRTRMVLALPDVNGDGVADIAVVRDQPIRVEIRSGANNGLLNTVAFLDAFAGTTFLPVDAAVVGDADGNGVLEIAILFRRYSDGRGVVEMRNVTGTPAARQVWVSACHKPLALAVIADDADGNGVPELAVLSTRNSDGRGLVEVKNAYGATNPVSIWSMIGYTPSDLEVVPDADSNGVPEVAVLEARDTDGRMVVDIKNASGPTNPNSVWFMAGNSPIDLAVVGDKDGNGVPEVAVLSSRDSDGRLVVEVRNAAGATNPSAVWFMAGNTGLALKPVADADGNGVPELVVLSRRNSDGRLLVEVKNAVVPTNTRSLWYPAGYTAWDLEVLPDLDGNGVEEAGVLLVRDSDGRLVVQRRNAAGAQAPVDYWFTP
jgi:hypothetical protein